MTHLERDWEDLPVGAAPLDALLREGRREAARDAGAPRRRLWRSLGVIAVVGGIAAAFVAGTLATSPDPVGLGSALPPGSGPPGGGDGDVATPVAFFGDLQASKSCDELLAHYVDAGVDLVGAYGWSSPTILDYRAEAGGPLPQSLDERAPVPTSARGPQDLAAPETTRSTSSQTGTNVQESGVDEPDSVKTDGDVLVRLRRSVLTSYDVSGTSVRQLGSLDLGDFHDGEILLAGDTVVAIGNDGTRQGGDDYASGFAYDAVSLQTRVISVDLADPRDLAVLSSVDYDAATVTARQHGTDIRLVLSAGLPELDFVRPGRNGGRQEVALRTNRDLVAGTSITDWLPTVSIDGGEVRQLLDCDQVAVPRDDVGLGTTAVVGFATAAPIEGPADLDAFGLAGDASLAYESLDHLYLATPSAGGTCSFCDIVLDASRDGTTHVYDFALDGTQATYVGAGEVEGTIRDRWAMDEYDGVLRLAVGPSSETGPFNSIVTMQARGDQLVELGRVDRLGLGEDIMSVRWFDGLAIMVTFRQFDPLYAVDLSDQKNPTLIGKLKIPGFSSYLHPLGSMRMIGLGEGPQPGGRRWGAQAGLFDVSDLTDPRRLDVLSYGSGSQPKAGVDPRQFTWLPRERTTLTVIQKGRAAFVSSLKVDSGQLSNTMTRVEFGSDVDEVRTVPIYGAEGVKVILVTGEDVTFFDIP